MHVYACNDIRYSVKGTIFKHTAIKWTPASPDTNHKEKVLVNIWKNISDQINKSQYWKTYETFRMSKIQYYDAKL